MASSYGNYSIIIADNASDDDSVEFVKENYPHLAILKSTINNGFAGGYNQALKQVVAEYFVLLNTDIQVEPGWIEPVIDLMESDKLIAACQPKILSFADKTMFEYAGACGGWLDSFGYPFSRGRVFDVCEKDNGQYNEEQQVFWATGAALFVRAEAFKKMNGFDEYFFAHQEEIDLCWRLQLAGYKIYVQPKSVVYHVGGGTLPMGNKKKVYLNFRNNLIMLTKNLPAKQALWKIPFRMGLDNIAGLKGLFTGSGITFIAIAYAHWHYVKWLISHKKQNSSPAHKDGNLHGLYKGLVIWQYFVKGKKTFSEIIANKK